MGRHAKPNKIGKWTGRAVKQAVRIAIKAYMDDGSIWSELARWVGEFL